MLKERNRAGKPADRIACAVLLISLKNTYYCLKLDKHWHTTEGFSYRFEILHFICVLYTLNLLSFMTLTNKKKKGRYKKKFIPIKQEFLNYRLLQHFAKPRLLKILSLLCFPSPDLGVSLKKLTQD